MRRCSAYAANRMLRSPHWMRQGTASSRMQLQGVFLSCGRRSSLPRAGEAKRRAGCRAASHIRGVSGAFCDLGSAVRGTAGYGSRHWLTSTHGRWMAPVANCVVGAKCFVGGQPTDVQRFWQWSRRSGW
jgi:hypothetical protein